MANRIEQNHDSPDFEVVATVLWHIWKTRNNFVFRRQQPDPIRVVNLALASIWTAQLSNSDGRGTGYHRLKPDDLWRPPDPGFLKVNIDGVFQLEGNEGTMACICRDQNGKLIDGLTRSFVASSALQAEFQALTITLHYLLEQSKAHDRMVLESDSKILVETIQGLRSTPWEVRSIFAEAAALLQGFSNLQIRFCQRGANFVAD
ncbi:hypothetical protein ACJRO7_016056 [Eucalyptus globulus]|uniref:RNase H type-1 domain-containing protein n=1 Tax=Eucalyptus globulus TaxID=34317 RepID=A0ABD3LBC9_EUCGL